MDLEWGKEGRKRKPGLMSTARPTLGRCREALPSLGVRTWTFGSGLGKDEGRELGHDGVDPVPGRPEEEYRHQLGRYGISGELAMRPVASLSGGQKSRVAFAQMTMPW